MQITSLDLSTVTCGYSFFNCGKLEKYGYVDISKKESLKEKKEEIFKRIKNIIECSNVILLEDYIKYAPLSNAITITNLAHFQGYIKGIIEHVTDKECVLINHRSALKLIPDYNKKSKLSLNELNPKFKDNYLKSQKVKKIITFEYIQNSEYNFQIEYSKKDKIIEQNFDISDSIINYMYFKSLNVK